jgi:hypothetical protein
MISSAAFINNCSGSNLIEGHNRGDVQVDARLSEMPDQFGRALRFGISDWDLHMDVGTPSSNYSSLTLHFGAVAGEDFE